MNTPYDWLTHNCTDPVEAGLEAAGVKYSTGFTPSSLFCGSPRKLDNLNRCKMACKLTQERPFYEKILRQQIQESRSA